MDSSSYPVLPPPATPPRRPPKRSHQLVGEHFESPRRRRRWRQDSQIIDRPDLALLEQRYTRELDQLLRGTSNSHHPQEDGPSPPADDTSDKAASPNECSAPSDPELDKLHNESDSQEIPEAHPRRLVPDEASHKLYNNWLALIPTLYQHYLGYMKRTQGRIGRPLETKTYTCSGGSCTGPREWEMQCLHFDRG